MDRLFGKELSNLLHPISNNYSMLTKISKPAKEVDMSLKEQQKKHEVRSTSVNHDNKKYSCKSLL